MLFLTTCYTSTILLYILKKKKILKNQDLWPLVSFIFIFLSRWINLNKINLIHLNKNKKTKENCFKTF